MNFDLMLTHREFFWRNIPCRALLYIDEHSKFTAAHPRSRILIRESVRNPKLLPTIHVNAELEEVDDDKSLYDEDSQECDAAFFDCMGSTACTDCFDQMIENTIDWAGVTQDTQCDTVVAALQKKNICTTLGTGQSTDRTLFCKTFKSCVEFDAASVYNKTEVILDCNALDKCDWPGIHKSFIGDGVCQDAYYNTCYNTKVCGYDYGDCCKDTCERQKSGFSKCGTDGYACRDPNSISCDPTLTMLCPASSYKNDDKDRLVPVCSKDESLYRLVMYDSFGDGWEDTTITILPTTGASQGQKLTPVYTGGLKSGAEGTEYLCLSLNPMCYQVNVTGGMWGREASWYIKGFNEGSPAVASGGGSMNCEFTVAGGSCINTCTGTSKHAPGQDPQYRDFKKMVNCIEDKCMLQVTACNADPSCAKCYAEEIPDYCFSIDSFLAVTDCSMCKCSGVDDSYFCNDKQAPGMIVPTPKNGGKEAQPIPCTPAQTLGGGKALIDFSKCMDNYDQTPLMLTDFDSNKFGELDLFEACAHEFRDKDNHGGRKALDCLQILVNAMDPDAKAGQPTAVIKQLATLLYTHGQTFCECANQASKDCPLCPSFFNFKTLIYEAIDACASLDNIDCDAWDEFQEPCQANLVQKFGSVNFAQKGQCEYMADKCGGTTPFPSFRRLDCQVELSADSWNFYLEYAKLCMASPDGRVVPGPPVPTPASAPVDTAPKAKTKPPTPYQPIDPNIKPKPYSGQVPTPTNDNGRPSYKSPDGDRKKSHWFRNLVLFGIVGGIGYYIYKRRADGFNFVRYRRMTNFGANDGGYGFDDSMYSGLSLESSTTFEPPSLPPTPMSMPNNGGYGA
jgi:hypothetical protein